jgi:hypothetical protein
MPGGWVDPTAGLDVVAKRRVFVLPGLDVLTKTK